MEKKTAANKTKKADKLSAEEKIKQAARKLFTKHGYAAVKTRKIADEAGINHALLHYYFRSKDKLFEIIMLENLSLFITGVAAIVNDKKTSLEQKIKLLISTYIDKLSREPELPMFILNQIKTNPDYFLEKLGIEELIKESYLLKQIFESRYPGMIRSFDPVNIVINSVSLTVAPFLMAPMLQAILKLNQQQFMALMQERKALIPEWVASMVEKGFVFK